MQPNEFFNNLQKMILRAWNTKIRNFSEFNPVVVIKSEENPALDLLANLMDPSLLYFDDKRSYDQPVVLNKPDMAVFSRILEQAKSSHLPRFLSENT